MSKNTKDIRTHEADYKLTQKFLDYANVADASYALLEYTNEGYEIDRNKNDFGDGQKQYAIYTDKNTNTDYISTYARAIEARFNKDSKNSQGNKIDNKIQNVFKEIDSTQYKDSNGCHIFNAENNICQKLYPKGLYIILGILVVLLLNGCSTKIFNSQYDEFQKLCEEVSGIYEYEEPLIEVSNGYKGNLPSNDDKWEQDMIGEITYILHKQGKITQVFTMYANSIKNEKGFAVESYAIEIGFIYDKGGFFMPKIDGTPFQNTDSCMNRDNKFTLNKGERWSYFAVLESGLQLSYRFKYIKENKHNVWFQKGRKTSFNEIKVGEK